MYRRDISKALIGIAASSAMLSRPADALAGCSTTPATTPTQPGWPQSPAETTAGVTPVNYCYPPLWVDRYGTNATPGTTDMTSAINTAIAVAAVQASTGQSGERVILQATTYAIGSPTTGTNNIVIPTGVTLQGAGGCGIAPGKTTGAGTCLLYTNSGTSNPLANTAAVQLGNSATSLTGFPAVADLAIGLANAETYGVQFLCTLNGSARNIYVLNQAGSSIQSQNGFVIGLASGSPTVSSFFNTLTNCYAENVHQGFVFDSGGGTVPTQTTFIQCGATGLYSSDTSGSGVLFCQAGDGQGSIFVGCWFTNFNTGVYLNGTPLVTFQGVDFEGCKNDIGWSGSDTGVTFIDPPLTLTQSGTPGKGCGTLYGATPTTGSQTATFSASNKPGTSSTAPSAWLPVFVPNSSGGTTYYVPLWQ
jgi:hypothetical protein